MTVGIVGLGLIGGSLALSLRSAPYVEKIIGSDQSKEHEKVALDMGLVDEVSPQDDLIKRCEVILLAIPVHHIAGLLTSILNEINSTQTVIDFGSTKSEICLSVCNHPKRAQFVAAHPMAGTENTGPTAAINGLFKQKVNIICEKHLSGAPSLKTANRIFDALEMRTIYMSAEEHDKHIAYVSHLSHISSFMLGLTVLDIEKDEKNIFNMAGSGFESTVRLAMSSAEMWAPIFDQNADKISQALDAYINHLVQFRDLINSHNKKEIKLLIKKANVIRKVLKPNQTEFLP